MGTFYVYTLHLQYSQLTNTKMDWIILLGLDMWLHWISWGCRRSASKPIIWVPAGVFLCWSWSMHSRRPMMWKCPMCLKPDDKATFQLCSRMREFPFIHLSSSFPLSIGMQFSIIFFRSLAKEELGWEAHRTLEEMCADFWRWQTMNPQGYKTALTNGHAHWKQSWAACTYYTFK